MDAVTGKSRGVWLHGAFGARTLCCLGYLLSGVPTTSLAWLVALVAVVGGALLSVTVIGILAAPLLLMPVRAAAGLERWRCGLVLPTRPASPYRPVDGLTGRVRTRMRLRDPATWRDLAWLVLAFPLDLGAVVLAGTAWAFALGMTSLPVWYRFLPGGQAKLYESGGVAHGVIDSVPTALPWAALGLFLLWVAGWLTCGLAAGQARLAAAVLRPTRATGLRIRVATLSATRTAAIEGQQRELHRIERDLHDGAQARLVALSADLGLADEAFDDDPEHARRLVEGARDGVLLALAELRDLVRGIGPPVLRDRGLAAALEAVTARSPIPVALTVSVARRPPSTAEAAAYFVACEALANAAKHSGARTVTVDLRVQGGTCVVSVVDDGTGGADPQGAGLTGLADRVAALDGRLLVESPAGGPTVIRAVLPCGW
jgi:signal transduction histidine kinase